MKILLLLFFFPFDAFAAKAVVLVLEAPLLKKADHHAEIINYVRKGDVIYINSKDVDSAPDETRWELGNLEGVYLSEYKNKLDADDPVDKRKFYQTVSEGGYSAYIARKFVKVLYHDEREYLEPISPFSFDPTDYRPIEPIHENFPFLHQDRRKAGAGFSLGPSRKINYPYPTQIIQEKFDLRRGFSIYYTTRISFDDFNRFYTGIVFTFLSSNASFTLANDITTEENYRQFGIGPYLSYDFHRNENYLLTVYGSLTFNMDRFRVNQTRPVGTNEERLFTGFSFTPRVGHNFQIRNIIPNIDLYLSAEVQITLPHTLKSSSSASIQNIWQFWQDRIKIPFGGNINLFVGIQSVY